MSDETNNGNDNESGTPPIDRQARLEDIIAKRASEGTAASPPTVTVQAPRRNVRYNTFNDTFTDLDSGQQYTSAEVEMAATYDDADPNQLLHDDGRSLQHSVDQIYNEYERLCIKADAHHFDPISGEKVYEHTPAERGLMKQQIQQLAASGKEEVERGNLIAAQRKRLKDAADRQAVASLQREQRVEALTAEAIERLEAEERAKLIVARKGQLNW